MKAPSPIPYKMGILVLPQNNGKKTILKHIEFDSKAKRPLSPAVSPRRVESEAEEPTAFAVRAPDCMNRKN